MLIKNDHSPVSFPVLNPYGHVAFQAQRGDVHTVLVDGRVVKSDGKLVGIDLAPRARRDRGHHRLPARRECGEEVWQPGMYPEMPADEAAVLDNPYQYSDYKDESKRAGGEDACSAADEHEADDGRAGNGSGLRRGAGARAWTCWPASTPTARR